ncbi:MAG: rhomboid family intramembrane serine protease [Bacteroidetes bacterium]|nr:rhomboid family intramembrane serine protease [Bacteroidota bacterium]
MNVFSVDQDILDFWAPWVFPWIPILIWLRPRIKLLNLKNKKGKGDPLFGYMMLASFTIAVPIMVSQAYLETATGKLTQLQRISQIDSLPQTKFYTVNAFYADKQLARVKPVFKISGKYNSDFDMYIYVAVPVYDSNHVIQIDSGGITAKARLASRSDAIIVLNGLIISKKAFSRLNPHMITDIKVLKGAAATSIYGDQARNGAILIGTGDGGGYGTSQLLNEGNANYSPSAWLAIKYEKTISNHLSNDEKEQKYKEFAKTSEEDFKSKSLEQFQYLDRVPYGSDLKGYQAAMNSGKYPVISNNIFLLVNESFDARNGSALPWIFGAMGIGSAIFLITLLFKPLRTNAESIDIEGEAKDDQKTFFVWTKALIIPQKRLMVTQILIQINLLTFILMVCYGLGFMSFNAADLLRLGANYRPAIDKGEYWRLVTNIFLHGGLMHVLMNMYGLFFVGLFLEPVMGRGKYLLTYLVTGIAASIASMWWHPATVSVGASGAIFGLFGAFFALITVNMFPSKSKKSFLASTSIFIGYNLLFGLTGGIDNAAHIGGLISGLLLGYAFYPWLKKKRRMNPQLRIPQT